MFEQDYIMRLIRELVRTILKLLFNIDTETVALDVLSDSEEQDMLNTLIDLIEKGDINRILRMLPILHFRILATL